MAVRIEYLLMAIFAILIVSIFGFNPISKEAVSSKGEREVEFRNFSVYNIKEDDTGRQLHAVRAIKYKNYMDFEKVVLEDEQGHIIHSNKAIYEDDLLYMNEHVKVSRDDGVDFFTESLNYDLKEKRIATEEPFLLEFNQSVIRGKKLDFSVEGKIISGNEVDAHIWFIPKEDSNITEE